MTQPANQHADPAPTSFSGDQTDFAALDLLRLLAGLPLFNGIAPDLLAPLVGRLRRYRAEAGERLFERGAPGDALYVILSGEVQIVSTDERGQPFVLRRLAAGQTVGELALLDALPRSAAAVCDSDCDLLILARAVFLDLLAQHPLVGVMMMRNLVERIRYTTYALQSVLEATERLTRGDPSRLAPDTDDAGVDVARLTAAWLSLARDLSGTG